MTDRTSPNAQPVAYYSDDLTTIYHGECEAILPGLQADNFACLLMDPPYGFDYRTNSPRVDLARQIARDTDTSVRDHALLWWPADKPALVFGSWKVTRPVMTKGVLVWDKGGALGMGDLSMPWKFDHEEVYVLGRGFAGKRDCGSVLRFPPVQSMASNGRMHPNEKPVSLLKALLGKCPGGAVIDPTMGVGSTLVAAKAMGRKAVGIELEERYCELAARRLSQGTLDFEAPLAQREQVVNL